MFIEFDEDDDDEEADNEEDEEYEDKWYIKTFPAATTEMAPPTTHNTMARLFQTEKSKMGQKDKAEFLQKSMTVRKWSMLPKGN